MILVLCFCVLNLNMCFWLRYDCVYLLIGVGCIFLEVFLDDVGRKG